MKEQTPLVSVVLPAYNAENTIVRALDSIAQQTYQNFEVIIVNDGSSDRTCSVVQDYLLASPSFHAVLIDQENRGVSRARNCGIEKAKGDWIAFLDADDEWMPDKLEQQLSLLSETNVALISCLKTEPGKHVSPFSVYSLKEMLFKNRIMTSGVLVQKSMLEKIGMFDETLRYSEDYNLWLKIAEISPLYVINKKLIVYDDLQNNPNKSSSSTNLKAMEKGELQNYRQLYLKGSISWFYYKMACIWSYMKYIRRIISFH